MSEFDVAAVVDSALVAAFDGRVGQITHERLRGWRRWCDAADRPRPGRHGVRVCPLVPGLVDTLLTGLPEGARTALANGIPFPERMGHPVTRRGRRST